MRSLRPVIERLCREAGASEIRPREDAEQRPLMWKGRKAAFAAMGRVSPDYYVQDGVIPRTKLPEVLRGIRELEAEYGLRVGNVFHAGDGNLHPLVLYDGAEEGASDRALEVAQRRSSSCASSTAARSPASTASAHDKVCSMPKMFSGDDLTVMDRLRAAFDPAGLCEPRQGAADAAPVRRGAGVPPRASGRGGRARGALLMLRPTTEEEVAELLRAADAEGRTLVPRGGGTKLGWGRPAEGEPLSLRELDRLVALEPGDFVCVAQAGMRLADLDAALRAEPGHRQRLMLDPPHGARRDARRDRGRERVRPAPPSLRGAARPRDRRPARPRRRHPREDRRQGREERRRLRPGAAAVRLARLAGGDHRAGIPAPPRAGGVAHRAARDARCGAKPRGSPRRRGRAG